MTNQLFTTEEIERIPSDLSIEHHTRRTCEYNLDLSEPEDYSATNNNNDWFVNDICISDLCLNVKAVSLPIDTCSGKKKSLHDIDSFKRFISAFTKLETFKFSISLIVEM
ncbi:hypothetical protein MFLAVUS_005836 [Mucor flavus]|uniref:Uncharacterized protein n=1 Tax=Mucor flavus TaxID=439312 RepID=A0ABP9YZT9_9FUNG